MVAATGCGRRARFIRPHWAINMRPPARVILESNGPIFVGWTPMETRSQLKPC